MDSPPDPPIDHRSVFDLALLSDVGTNRPGNEDSCGHFVESPHCVVFAIADGVGGYEGGEIASKIAVDTTLEVFRESPVEWGGAKRLYRAIQRANIEIHNKALTVPELGRMATTLTAAVVDKGMVSAVHVGDCRLYLVRHGKISQVTKDHTMVGERVRMGLMTQQAAKEHPERSMLLRSLGHELIVSMDRISLPLIQDDRLILSSDGLYNVLEDGDLEALSRGPAEEACREMIQTANQRGTADNLTVAVFKMIAATEHHPASGGFLGRIAAMFRRGR